MFDAQWEKIYACESDMQRLELIYMWVKQDVIDRKCFVEMIEYLGYGISEYFKGF